MKKKYIILFALLLILSFLLPGNTYAIKDSWIATKPLDTKKTKDGFQYNFTSDEDAIIYWNDNSYQIRKDVHIMLSRFNILKTEVSINKDNYKNYSSQDVHWMFCINLGKLKPGVYIFDIQGDAEYYVGEIFSFIVINTNSKTAKSGYQGLKIVGLDKIKEVITIENTGDCDVNLKGYEIRSVRGQQKFFFPNYKLRQGFQVKVSRVKKDGDLVWGKGEYVWNDKKSEQATLSDDKGRVFTGLKK